MGNRDVASIGKILALAGVFSVIFGFSLFAATNAGGLCSVPLQQPGSNGPGCAVDSNPLVLPSVIGGALIAAGAWLFWVFRPQSWTPSSRYDNSTGDLPRQLLWIGICT